MCRLVEWYVQNLDGISANGTSIIALDPEPELVPPSQGPYR